MEIINTEINEIIDNIKSDILLTRDSESWDTVFDSDVISVTY